MVSSSLYSNKLRLSEERFLKGYLFIAEKNKLVDFISLITNNFKIDHLNI